MDGEPERRADDHRTRLMAGMAAALADDGYAALSIADIVSQARVSKRTFYEHFASKQECLLALYEEESERLLERIAAVLYEAPPGEARLHAGVAVYLQGLQARPGVVRALLVEILAAGRSGLEVRRAVHRRFAELLLRHAGEADTGAELSPALALALVGGIHELILEAVEAERTDRLTELVRPITALVRAVLFAPRPAF